MKKIGFIILLLLTSFYTAPSLYAYDTSYKDIMYPLNGEYVQYYEVVKYFENYYGEEVMEHSLDVIDGEIYFEFIDGRTVDTMDIEMVYDLGEGSDYQMLVEVLETEIITKNDRDTLQIVIDSMEGGYVVAEHYYNDIELIMNNFSAYLTENPKQARSYPYWYRDYSVNAKSTNYKIWAESYSGNSTYLSDAIIVTEKKFVSDDWNDVGSKTCSYWHPFSPTKSYRYVKTGNKCSFKRTEYQHQKNTPIYDSREVYYRSDAPARPTDYITFSGDKMSVSSILGTDTYENSVIISDSGVPKYNYSQEINYTATAKDAGGNVVKFTKDNTTFVSETDILNSSGYKVYNPGFTTFYITSHYNNPSMMRKDRQLISDTSSADAKGGTFKREIYIHKDLSDYRKTTKSSSKILSEMKSTCNYSSQVSKDNCVQDQFRLLSSALIYEEYQEIFDDNLNNKNLKGLYDLYSNIDHLKGVITLPYEVYTQGPYVLVKYLVDDLIGVIKEEIVYFGIDKYWTVEEIDRITVTISNYLTQAGLTEYLNQEDFIETLTYIHFVENSYYLVNIYGYLL